MLRFYNRIGNYIFSYISGNYIFSYNYFFKKPHICNVICTKRSWFLQKWNFCSLTSLLILLLLLMVVDKYVWPNLSYTNTFGLNSSEIQLWGKNIDSLVKYREKKLTEQRTGWEVTKNVSGTIKVDLGRTKLLYSARVLEERETARKILMIKPGNIQHIF